MLKLKLSRCWLVLAVAAVGWALSPTTAQQLSNKQCLECHSDKELTKTNQTGRVISLFIDETKLGSSKHATNTCASCPVDLKSTHPDDDVAAKPVDCARCHDNASQSYAASVHGLAIK